MVALFFELPKEPVKPGDEWEIDVTFVRMGPNFICDWRESHRTVSLVSLKKEGDDPVAVLDYDIHEEVRGHFDGTAVENYTVVYFRGTGEFLVEKG